MRRVHHISKSSLLARCQQILPLVFKWFAYIWWWWKIFFMLGWRSVSCFLAFTSVIISYYFKLIVYLEISISKVNWKKWSLWNIWEPVLGSWWRVWTEYVEVFLAFGFSRDARKLPIVVILYLMHMSCCCSAISFRCSIKAQLGTFI